MPPAAATTFISALQSRRALIGVIGLGYVGLPLVREFIHQNFRVLGFDTDAAKVSQLNAGLSTIGHLPSADIAQWRQSGRFEATADLSRLSEPDALLICVPTPLNLHREPDMSFVRATTQAIGEALRPGQLVVLESTTYPGTTADLVRPELERRSNLTAGRDFWLAFSPEREDPGNPNFSTGTIPKVLGADDDLSRRTAQALYGAIVPAVVTVASTAAAEATKLFENVFRAVNIALVNELKIVFARMEIDIWDVIEAAKTKPFGFMPFYPGPGIGGPCIPKDPFYLAWKAREFGITARFIELAGETNWAVPRYVVQRVIEALNETSKPLNGARILLLGVAYKPNVDDTRESPALTLLELLEQHGARVDYFDPHCTRLHPTRRYPNLERQSVPELTPALLQGADAVLIATHHTAIDYQMVVTHASLVIDTRNACHGLTGRARVVKA